MRTKREDGRDQPDWGEARAGRACARCDEDGAETARARAGAAAAVEKNAFVLRALFSALRERRCTPREVSIVDDVDDECLGEQA